MRSRNKIVAVVSVLVLTLLIAAGFATNWGGVSNSTFALEGPQTTAAQPVVDLQAPAVQVEEGQVIPTQDVLTSLYNAVAPSVVNIQVSQTATTGEAQALPDLPFDLPEGEEAPPILQGQGSGFIYDNDGHIVTNNHVVADADSIIVYFNNGMWAEAELVARDPAADLAVLRVTPPEGVDWRPLPIASVDSLRVGYYVAALGSPFGLTESMTTGIVSALGRSFPTDDVAGGATYSLPDVIQTDAAINPGNSGGPLLNLQGEVVGVNFAINSPVRANSGVGFAIPVSVVEQVVPALIAEGEYSYSYLGILGTTIDANLAEAEDLEQNVLGIYVAQVVEGGPAAEGGLEAGDIITAINNEPVSGFEDLISYLFQSTTPGDTVALTVIRDGEIQELEVTLTERPSAPEQQERPEMAIGITEAIRAASAAVAEAGLMDNIESANAQPDMQNGNPVWVVTLSGDNNTATVVVDGQTGEVIELDVQ